MFSVHGCRTEHPPAVSVLHYLMSVSLPLSLLHTYVSRRHRTIRRQALVHTPALPKIANLLECQHGIIVLKHFTLYTSNVELL